ncbi:MAG: group III truncated hemoglobin [Sphingomonadales bacterium]|nr:group III truncated hemoglobin [Sphingomonadales bacterium]
MTTPPDRSQPLRKQGHPHARAARARKQAEAAEIGIDAAYIAAFIDQFYARIREDAVLGPIFAARITDWGPHLARMNQFWRGVLLNSGEYSGNPMRLHTAIPGLNGEHFARWLALFYATLDELKADPQATGQVASRARMIADSLLTGIAIQRDGLGAGRVGDGLPRHRLDPMQT